MSVETNSQILSQLALLGTIENRLEDFLRDPERGTKLLQSFVALDPASIGFRNEDIFAAAQGICRLTEDLLSHLTVKYKENDRIRNVLPSGKLLLALKAGPVIDHKGLNRIIGTFYLDWPYAAHWRRDLYRIPEGGLTIYGLVFGGLQKLRDLLDEQLGLA